jgi:hypothetical protein
MGNDSMALPLATDRIWSDLVTGRKAIAYEFMAAKMLIARLRLVMHADRQPAVEARCAIELYQLYEENAELPSARRDLEKLAAGR